MSLHKSESLGKPEVKPKEPIFDIKSMIEVVSEVVEPPKKLAGSLVYDQELTILFGESNTGKSLLAVSIAYSVSKGIDLDFGNGIILENESDPLTAILFDFELSQAQTQGRYDKDVDFNNFHRAELKYDQYTSEKPEELVEQLEDAINAVNAKFIVIDNISAISGDIEKAKYAVPFLQEFKRLIRRTGITVLVIGHTPKKKEFTSLTMDSLSGIAKLAQLADAVLAIGKANTEEGNEFYIIDLKGRNASKTYHKGNVIHTKIEKARGLLQHVAIGTAKEQDLLNGNVFENIDRPLIKLYTYAYIYYGSKRKAEEALKEPLKEVGINANNSTIIDNAKRFKKMLPDSYKELEKMSDEDLYSLMNQESPTENYLPQKEGHESDEIPF